VDEIYVVLCLEGTSKDVAAQLQARLNEYSGCALQACIDAPMQDALLVVLRRPPRMGAMRCEVVR